MSTSLLWQWVRPISTAVIVLQLAGCITPALDRHITMLNQEITAERATLFPLAAPYRGAAREDVQLDIIGTPIEDTIEAYNNLGFNDRTMTIQSFGYSGYIAQGWTDCPWPLPGRIGFQVVPAFNESFFGLLHVDHIDHSWNQNDGLAFSLQNALGAAGFIVGGRVELCNLSGTIPIGGAVVVLGARSATGSTSLDAPSGDSIIYHVHLTQPIYLIAYVVTPVFSGTVPLWFKLELTKGKIPSVLGQNGTIQVTPTGESRDYALVIELQQSAFLQQGLTASGKVTINWQPRVFVTSNEKH